MIILRTKTFTDNNKKGKKNTTEDAMRGFVGKLIEDYMRNEKKKEHGRPGRQERKLNRLKARIQSTDNEIEIRNRTKELRHKQNILDNLLHPNPENTNKVKSIVSDPKFKKGAKIAGLATLGAGVITGSTLGGIKLKKKIDEKRKNEKIKNSIANDDDKD